MAGNALVCLLAVAELVDQTEDNIFQGGRNVVELKAGHIEFGIRVLSAPAACCVKEDLCMFDQLMGQTHQ